MFLVAEIGSLIKIIASVFAYLIFIPINLLDKYCISKILYEQSSSKTLALVVVLLIFFVTLGILMRSIVFAFIVVAVLLGIFLLRDFIIGLLFFYIAIYFMRKMAGMKNPN